MLERDLLERLPLEGFVSGDGAEVMLHEGSGGAYVCFLWRVVRFVLIWL